MRREDKKRGPWGRWAVIAVFLVLLLAALALAFMDRAVASEPTGEVIQFNHQKHVSAGVQCVFCHPGALNGAVATIPSVEKCMGCHRSVEVTSEQGQAAVAVLIQHWEDGLPLRWEKTYDQPDFVYLPHRSHINAGVNCEACHGNVSEMTVVRQAYRINMGFCLHCHRQQPPEQVEGLISCANCHY